MSESTERAYLLLNASEGSSGSFCQDSSYNGDETETEDAKGVGELAATESDHVCFTVPDHFRTAGGCAGALRAARS